MIDYKNMIKELPDPLIYGTNEYSGADTWRFFKIFGEEIRTALQFMQTHQKEIEKLTAGTHFLVPKTALEWLFGEGPDEQGKFFNPEECLGHPPKGTYWWRSHFRKLLSASQKPSEGE